MKYLAANCKLHINILHWATRNIGETILSRIGFKNSTEQIKQQIFCIQSVSILIEKKIVKI